MNDDSDNAVPLRNSDGRWRKGAPSPNPSGRPRVLRDVVEKAREYTVESIETLATIMRDEQQPGATRVAAADKILDRGYGRPTQFVGVDDTMDDGMLNVEQMSTRELALLVRRQMIARGASEAEAVAIAASPDDELPVASTGTHRTVQ